MITGAQALVQALQNEGCDVIFGYPGVAICPFYDALTASPIRHILVRQEQNAGHAASGYARIKNKAGVCCATSGPGATNLITALATAYMDSIPLVAITGQVSRDMLGRDVFQEVDITGATEPFTKHSYLIKDANDIPRVVQEAFYIAQTGRPGPVLIDVPVDVQMEECQTPEPPKHVHIRGYKPTVTGHAAQIKRTLEAINEASRPLICAGGGVISSGAQPELLEFAQKMQIPVVTTMMGIGAVEPGHPLALGMIGNYGSTRANEVLLKADLLILIGARVGDRAVRNPDVLFEKAKIVHIDVDPAEIGKNMGTHIPIVGDIHTVLNQLLSLTEPLTHTQWLEEIASIPKPYPPALCHQDGFLNPKALLPQIFARLAPNAIVVADVGQNQIWAANTYNLAQGRFLTSGGLGTMGYSLPAAMGAKAAAPKRQVVCICGDGSFQMMLQELATISQNDLDVKIIVMRNDCLGLVREYQKRFYAGNFTAVQLHALPNIQAIGLAYNIPAFLLSEQEQVEPTVQAFLQTAGSAILEIIIRPDESSR